MWYASNGIHIYIITAYNNTEFIIINYSGKVSKIILKTKLIDIFAIHFITHKKIVL